MKNTVVDIHDIRKSFGDVNAVNGVSVTVHSGEMFAFVGPDGAGKTTLMRILCGVLHPDSGTGTVAGHDLITHIDEVKKKIGYLSQRFSLYGDLTIDENIEFFARIHGVKDFHSKRNELLDFMRLTPFRSRRADRLSGGMKQKLALSCTLIHTPEVLFLDEPTTGVDPVSRRDFWKILSHLLKSGITIIMNTPYLDEAERCNRIGLINEGSILVTDTPQAMKKRMQGVLYEIVGSDIRSMAAQLLAEGISGEVQTFGDRVTVVLDKSHAAYQRLKAFIVRNNERITSSRVIPPTLENVFISLLRGQ